MKIRITPSLWDKPPPPALQPHPCRAKIIPGGWPAYKGILYYGWVLRAAGLIPGGSGATFKQLLSCGLPSVVPPGFIPGGVRSWCILNLLGFCTCSSSESSF